MQPLLLLANLQGALIELCSEERVGLSLISLVRNNTLNQRLSQDMGDRTEDWEFLFNKDILGRHNFLVLALVVSEKNLHA
jgi:hypothetical protein